MHVSGRNDPNQRVLATQRKYDMKHASHRRPPERVVSALRLTVPRIRNNEERITEKQGFRFGLGNAVFLLALSRVAIIPLESFHPIQLDHKCILP